MDVRPVDVYDDEADDDDEEVGEKHSLIQVSETQAPSQSLSRTLLIRCMAIALVMAVSFLSIFPFCYFSCLALWAIPYFQIFRFQDFQIRRCPDSRVRWLVLAVCLVLAEIRHWSFLMCFRPLFLPNRFHNEPTPVSAKKYTVVIWGL